MKKLFIRFLIFSAALLIGSTLPAQMPGSAPGGMNAAMLQLFGKKSAFTAQSDVKILDKSQKETTSLSMKMTYLEGKMRAELDMAQMKSDQFPPNALAQFQQMGMDKVVSVLRPDNKKMMVIYPTLKSYTEMPLPKDEASALDKEPVMQKTLLGKETIDGHPCTKNKIVITNDKEKQELTVWNASDLKELPVKIQTVEKDMTVIMQFKDIKLAKPDSKLFEAPAAFTKFENMQKLMMQKMTAPQ